MYMNWTDKCRNILKSWNHVYLKQARYICTVASEFGRPRTLLILVLMVHDTTVDLLLVKKPVWVGTAARTIVKGDRQNRSAAGVAGLGSN